MGLQRLFQRLEDLLELRQPLNVYLAGGMAVHLYTGARVTMDVDAEFCGRVHLPANLSIDLVLDDGTPHVIYLDTNYNAMFGLLHEDYQAAAHPLDLGTTQLRVHLLSPVDLAVSKIARFVDTDQEDIAALVRHGLTTADEIERRALGALGGYVGGQTFLKYNLRDAIDLAKDIERPRTRPKGLDYDR
jgi:hypothetical protein